MIFDPFELAVVILVSGLVFGILWTVDHRTHVAIWKRDITDGELRTHRLILYASYALMLSLGLMSVAKSAALPIFVGAWITRTLQEGIDELKWHVDRCSEFESVVHLGMWVSIHTGTAAAFIWGFFRDYEGFSSMPLWIHLGLAGLFVLYLYIGHLELTGYKDRKA